MFIACPSPRYAVFVCENVYGTWNSVTLYKRNCLLASCTARITLSERTRTKIREGNLRRNPNKPLFLPFRFITAPIPKPAERSHKLFLAKDDLGADAEYSAPDCRGCRGSGGSTVAELSTLLPPEWQQGGKGVSAAPNSQRTSRSVTQQAIESLRYGKNCLLNGVNFTKWNNIFV